MFRLANEKWQPFEWEYSTRYENSWQKKVKPSFSLLLFKLQFCFLFLKILLN